MNRLCLVVCGLFAGSASGAIIPVAGERSANANIHHWTQEGGHEDVNDIDWGMLGHGVFQGFAEATLNAGQAVFTARSWQDSQISATSLTARLQHELTWSGILDPKANTRAEAYPGFVLEFELTQPSRAEFRVGGYTLGGAYGYLEVLAGLYTGTLEDKYDGPQFGYRSSGSSGISGGSILDLPAGVYTIYFTVLGDSQVMLELPHLMSQSDVSASLILVPEVEGLLSLAILIFVRRR